MNPDSIPEAPQRRAFSAVALLEATALTLLALAVRCVRAGTPPFVDELYHVLAARSWLESGTLVIADGDPYTRARPYTMLVALMFRLFGEGLVQARIPSIAAGALLAGVVFLWMRWAVGRWPAWVAALLICFDAEAIAWSQIGRFYPLHVLLLWLGAFAFYALRARPRARPATAALAGAGILAFLGAFELHDLSIVGIAVVLTWFAIDGAPLAWQWMRTERHRPALVVGATVGAGLIALMAIGGPSAIGRYLRLYGWADLWAADNVGQWRYYHWVFQDQYGPLWALFPAIAAVAVLWKPRPALFLLWFFAASFAVQSLAAWKTTRYIVFATPAFLALAGIASTRVWGVARTAFLDAVARVSDGRLERVGAALFGIVATATVLLVLDASLVTRNTVWTLTRAAPDRPPPYPRSDWIAAARPLQEELAAADVVVASSDLKALFALGRLDFDLSADRLFRGGTFRPEFSRSERTGKPGIRSAVSMDRIRACHARGLVVLERVHAGLPAFVPEEIMDWLERNTEAVALPERLWVLAFRWTNGGSVAAECDAIRPRPVAHAGSTNAPTPRPAEASLTRRFCRARTAHGASQHRRPCIPVA